MLYPENECTFDDLSSIAPVDSYLSISYHDFKLGITFYQIGSPEISLLHEVYEYYDFSYTKSILFKVKPTNVIISSKCDSAMVRFLKSFSRNSSEIEQSDDDNEQNNNAPDNEENNANDNSPDSNASIYFEDIPQENTFTSVQFKLHIRSNRLYQYEQCKNRILSLNLPQMASMNDTKERFIYMTSNINFSEINTMKSFGVMLYVLEKDASMRFCPDIIAKFAYFNCQHVTMDQTTFEALEIFQQEWHPSTSKKGFYKKEGLSVYGIFNLCSSKLGSFQLKKLFQQPTTCFEILNERQEIVEFFTASANSNLKDNLIIHLKNLKDVMPIFNRFKALNFQFSDFESLYNVIASIIFIRNALTTLNKPLKLFSLIIKTASDELQEINKSLQNVIDYQRSKLNKCIEINKNVDEELDDLKIIFNKLPEMLSKAIADERHKVLNLRHVRHAYTPQLGFLFGVPLIQAQAIPNIEQYGLELRFCANDQAYYKTAKLKEFDDYFGDIQSDIKDQVQQVLIRLKDFILSHTHVLKSSISLCAQLDAFIAMAQTAINYNYYRPKLTVYGTIKIENSRHPLYELIANSFTANSFISNEDESKMTIIFGPNSCGKSVYLKQISLIVFLAHIGSFVPAEYAEITIVDQIFTRIRTPESISTQLSSFKHDLNQIIMATKYASQRSLVVIDFFGKGTLSVDGHALLTACINYWTESHRPPHVIISSLTQLGIFYSSKVKFYTFDRVTRFKLIPSEYADLTESDISQASLQLPELIKLKTNKLITDNFGADFKETFPKLDEKYNTYIELANYILEEDNIEQICNKIFQLTSNEQ